MNRPTGFYQVFNVVIQYVVFAYQAIVGIALVIAALLAVRYIEQPFLGSFISSNMLASSTGDDLPEWSLYNQVNQPRVSNHLESISLVDPTTNTTKTITPKSYDDIAFFLRGHLSGETVRTVFLSSEGKKRTFDTPISRFPLQSQTSYFYIPFIVGLIFFGFGVWTFRVRHDETTARAFAVFSSSTAFVMGGLLDLYATHYLIPLWEVALALIGASLIHLGLVFPQETRFVARAPLARLVGYIPGIILAGLNIYAFYAHNPTLAGTFRQGSYLLVGLSALFFIGMTLYRTRLSPSPVVRQQARVVWFGALIGFAPITIWLLATGFGFLVPFIPYWYFPPLAIFPATTAYTVMRYRLLRTDYVIKRSLLYVILTAIALIGYFLLATGFSIFFGTVVGPSYPLLMALAVLVIVFLVNILRGWLQERIDSVFFRSEHAHQERLKIFTRELTNTTDLNSILRILREQITVSLLPSQLHIYVYDALNDQYIATPDETKQVTSDIRFAADSSVPIVLREDALPLYVDMTRPPQSVMSERGRLAILGAQLFIPLPGRERLIGWLALGERLSGEPYASHDIAFLESLGSQSAVAFERAQVVSNMERRVNEMNALSRVAQGINITLNFDDILELIYAQTLQVISGDDFHLTLYNKTGQYFYYAFCLEGDERISSKEGIPLSSKTTLDQEIILSRRPILTQDFMGQSQIMGVTSNVRGLYAWLGVPLNAGQETIGSLSITSRDPSVTYTANHMDLLQSIADQAAGAIVKSRLLQETERRAQQLSTLNVITRQLTSTLDLQLLLKNILENAVSILNSEAGSLFLVDAQTDEMIFQVTVGPVASNLVGQRLPAGKGIVGKAVMSRQPVIINDVQASIGYNPATDKQTGYVTQTILAVPMEVKDRVIGVIEIINKKDGLPFIIEDQNLLSAFAGQAAVAIENARLYTLTDQELTARVEELSVMQRIDRELNASLEVDRAMRITLEWAMRQSLAEAGAIGFVGEKNVRLAAEQGYGDVMEKYKEEYLPREHKVVHEAIESGQPQRVLFESSDPARSFLPGTHSQLVIPIKREANVIGLFLLETTKVDGFQQNALNFLSRLSDHAAIAIANAQLYAEVQAANEAKSDFVNFVAHELKNPMTSIKGYAELLSAKAVGPITDMQASFLVTIRSNIERMKTIVEDLNDNAKIEAGRMRLDYKAVDVIEMVDDAIKSTKRQIEDKKQTISVSMPEVLPKVWADRTRVGQVLINLVSNAHKYTQEGGNIIVRAEQTNNTWDPEGVPEVVHIWVEDNGIGISPEDQKKIFQQFFRSEDDQARKSPGTGLGLNITRSLVEMQGGRIWFESEFRKGTIFHFTVPVSEN